MRVVIVGASGNVGTALLRALAADAETHEVIGVARRVPRGTPRPPYDTAGWLGCDLASRDREAVVRALTETMRGADAVVHLAWAIQPNHDRELLRRTNVDGTARVLEAATAAGVPHVVVASSVGAYAPARDHDLHEESWPTTGIPACEYSVDKADVEVLLDRHEAAHPDMTVTRLRPALIFQRDAGQQILRYFMGPLVPPSLLRGRLPVLPWPSGLRLQVVHADDAAAAYVRALHVAPGGAFNIAADGVLDADAVAAVTAGGRTVDVPVPAARAVVSAGWNARAVPTSPGWIDMAVGAPVMATDKAREVLEWSPRRGALDTLREILDGMAAHAGTSSPPLRGGRTSLSPRG